MCSFAEYFLEIRKHESDSATRAIITSPEVEVSTTQCLTLEAYAEIINDTETFEITANGQKADGTSWRLLSFSVFDWHNHTVVTFIEIPDGSYRVSIEIVFEAHYFFVHELNLSLGECDRGAFRKFVS